MRLLAPSQELAVPSPCFLPAPHSALVPSERAPAPSAPPACAPRAPLYRNLRYIGGHSRWRSGWSGPAAAGSGHWDPGPPHGAGGRGEFSSCPDRKPQVVPETPTPLGHSGLCFECPRDQPCRPLNLSRKKERLAQVGEWGTGGGEPLLQTRWFHQDANPAAASRAERPPSPTGCTREPLCSLVLIFAVWETFTSIPLFWQRTRLSAHLSQDCIHWAVL